LIFRTIRSIVRSDGEAERVAEAVWLSACREGTALAEGPGTALALGRMAVRSALASARRALPGVTRPVADGASFELGREAAPPQRALVSLLEQAIDRLPTDQRLVFVLRAVERCSSADTAALLGISEANVEVRLVRAHQTMGELRGPELDAALADVFAPSAGSTERMVDRVQAGLRSDPEKTARPSA
jgi:RNA polymerase sigma-70 factor (ECF subfamily)